MAGIAACSSGNGTVTINYGFSFLRPTTGTKVRCVAEPEKVGRTVSVFRCSLYNDEDKLVASGQFTFFMTGPLNLMNIKTIDSQPGRRIPLSGFFQTLRNLRVFFPSIRERKEGMPCAAQAAAHCVQPVSRPG